MIALVLLDLRGRACPMVRVVMAVDQDGMIVVAISSPGMNVLRRQRGQHGHGRRRKYRRQSTQRAAREHS